MEKEKHMKTPTH